MNKRLEDKLAMLAFGDLSPEEVAAVEREALADADASKALAEFKRMRTELRAMADVPAHQLSTERLRHAILSQGLKPKSRPSFGWLWMPAAACVLAFSLVVVKNMRGPLDSLGAGSGAVAVNSSRAEESIFTGANPFESSPPKASQVAALFEGVSVQTSVALTEQHFEAPEVTTRDNSSEVSRAPRTRRQRANGDVVALKTRVADKLGEAIASITSPANSESSQPAPMAALAARGGAPKRERTTVIIIDSTKDAATGAQRATEVESTSNVLVGG